MKKSTDFALLINAHSPLFKTADAYHLTIEGDFLVLGKALVDFSMAKIDSGVEVAGHGFR
jgi:hypothetical protein